MALFTVGENHNASDPNQYKKYDFNKLCLLVEKPRKALSLMPFTTQADIRTLKNFYRWFIPSDCLTKRKDDMVKHGNYCLLVADLDDGNQVLNDVHQLLISNGIERFVIYDTVSSIINNRRYRVVIELSEPVDCTVWSRLQLRLTGLLGGDHCATNPQQISYLPTLSLGNKLCYEFVIANGLALDPIQSPFAVKAAEEYQDIVLCNVVKKFKEVKLKLPVFEPSIETNEKINPYQLFNSVIGSWHQLLTQLGFKKYGSKWLLPTSTSGVPGIRISTDYRSDGGYVSNHRSDLLKDGKIHDKFDVWMVHGLGLNHNVQADRNVAIQKFSDEYILPSGISLRLHNRRVFMANKK